MIAVEGYIEWRGVCWISKSYITIATYSLGKWIQLEPRMLQLKNCELRVITWHDNWQYENGKKQKREIHHPCIAISEGYVEIGHSEEDFFLSIFWKVHFSMTPEQIYWEFSLFGPSCCFYAQFSSSELAKLWRCAIFWIYSAWKVLHSTCLANCFSGGQCFMCLAFLLHIRSHFMISKVARTPRKSKFKEIKFKRNITVLHTGGLAND